MYMYKHHLYSCSKSTNRFLQTKKLLVRSEYTITQIKISSSLTNVLSLVTLLNKLLKLWFADHQLHGKKFSDSDKQQLKMC